VSTSSISGVGANPNPADGTTTPAKSDPLGRDAFLSLLITQLQHQDPMQPEENGAFLAQLAQFSSLESLQQIKADMTALRVLVETSAASATPSATSTTPGTSVPKEGL
jgi:flagellar basal-body rod modification protein FlgD